LTSFPEFTYTLEITGKGPGATKGTEMNTITKTTASAVSRKLSSLGFEKKTENAVGFLVSVDDALKGWGTDIIVSSYSYHEGFFASSALEVAGYVVDRKFTCADHFTNLYLEVFTVIGRVGA
jgi:hypothetical protein